MTAVVYRTVRAQYEQLDVFASILFCQALIGSSGFNCYLSTTLSS